jgi:serine/threonine protein kinase
MTAPSALASEPPPPAALAATPEPAPEGVRRPSVAPLELARLRGAVRAGLFHEPAVPPRVGRYELLRCIGRGGMGIVYAARDVELGREVAIKLLRPELSGPADDRRLTAEAQALARLSHPNVITVFDVGTFGGQRFIAMEYVPGQDLRRWLDAPRTLADVLRVFAGAGRGLHAAHAVGLVHRDFKPDNVLVGDDGRPRVLDFGLARPPDGPGSLPGRPPALPAAVDVRSTVLTADGQVVGTPAYMAPEQHLGEPADARSDQFSFGVALYHAVYGVRPFAGDDPRTLALSIVRGRVCPATPRYPVPEWLERLLVRTLAVDPAQRFVSMDALLSVVEAKLGVDVPELRALPTRAVIDVVEDPEVDGSSGGIAVLDAIGLSPTWHAPQGPMVVSVTAAPALPSDESHEGLPQSLSTRRTLPEALDEATLEILTRELDRLGGRRGKVERLGTCLAWSTPKLEVHVDVTPRGSEILVWRRLAGELRRRTVGWMLFGTWLGCLFMAVMLASLEPIHGAVAEALSILVVFGSLIGGATMGYRKALGRHARALPSARADLEFVADRLVGLARANHRALPEG